MLFDEAVVLIRRARSHQDAKFGKYRKLPDKRWLRILQEELGESSAEIESHDDASLRDELAQTAAVAFCWLECRRDNEIRLFDDVLECVKEELKLQKALPVQYEDHEDILCKIVVALGEVANEISNGLPSDDWLEDDINVVAALVIWWLENLPSVLPKYQWTCKLGNHYATINGHNVGIFPYTEFGSVYKWTVREVTDVVQTHIHGLRDYHLDRLKVKAEQYFERLEE